MRQKTKQICYGIIYGMGTKALSEQLKESEVDAAEFLQSFHDKYSGVKKFIQDVINRCRGSSYVETIMGRRRYLPNINHQNSTIQRK